MPDKAKIPKGPKPWRGRTLRIVAEKIRIRKSWTRARWQRYVDERDERRNRVRLPRLYKIMRLRALWQRNDTAARSQRMRAYHARRRAAQSTAAPAPGGRLAEGV